MEYFTPKRFLQIDDINGDSYSLSKTLTLDNQSDVDREEIFLNPDETLLADTQSQTDDYVAKMNFKNSDYENDCEQLPFYDDSQDNSCYDDDSVVGFTENSCDASCSDIRPMPTPLRFAVHF